MLWCFQFCIGAGQDNVEVLRSFPIVLCCEIKVYQKQCVTLVTSFIESSLIFP